MDARPRKSRELMTKGIDADKARKIILAEGRPLTEDEMRECGWRDWQKGDVVTAETLNPYASLYEHLKAKNMRLAMPDDRRGEFVEYQMWPDFTLTAWARKI